MNTPGESKLTNKHLSNALNNLKKNNGIATTFLIFSRNEWTLFGKVSNLYKFTKKELDQAENREDGFVGERGGVKCYFRN